MDYLATPYSHSDFTVMKSRFDYACIIAAKLMGEGLIIFSPIAHTHPIAMAGALPTGWDFWDKYDRRFISVSDRLIVAMMDGWQESKGVQAEIKIATELGKPIKYLNLKFWRLYDNPRLSE